VGSGLDWHSLNIAGSKDHPFRIGHPSIKHILEIFQGNYLIPGKNALKRTGCCQKGGFLFSKHTESHFKGYSVYICIYNIA